MTITAGGDILAADFVQNPSSTSSADAGKVPYTTSDGKVRTSFVYGGDCGDGRDGNISVSSGNANIDLGGAKSVVLNYNDVSVTGTGSVTFINAHANGTLVYVRVKNRFKITSSAASAWNFDGCGASAATDGRSNFLLKNTAGQTGYAINPDSFGGIGGVPIGSSVSDSFLGFMPMACGSGGGNGGNSNGFFIGGGGGGGASGINSGTGGGSVDYASTNNGAGTGGRGGGAMAVFAHEWEVSGTVTGRGVAGGNATSSPGSGAGGGGGGCFYGRYHKLITNTGTYTMTGGAAGTNLGGASDGGVGGNGWSDIKEIALA